MLAIAASIPTVVLCVLAAAVLWPIVAHAALALDVFVLVLVLAWCRAPISDRAVPVASCLRPVCVVLAAVPRARRLVFHAIGSALFLAASQRYVHSAEAFCVRAAAPLLSDDLDSFATIRMQ